MRNRMLIAAGIIVLVTSVFVGCSKTEPVVETSEMISEVVSEVASEAVTEKEVVETSEIISTQIECPEKIELNLADGEEYISKEMLTESDVYSDLENIERIAQEKYGNRKDFDFRRDNMVALYCMTNYDKIDSNTLNAIVNDYLANWSKDDLTGVLTYYYSDEADFVDNNDLALLTDKTYKNEMEIFNYYFNLYVNSEDAEKSKEYYSILKGALNGNADGIFPLTFNENSTNANAPIYRLMSDKMMGYLEIYGNRDDYDDFYGFYYDDDVANNCYDYIQFCRNADEIAISQDTRIQNFDAYISTHK